MSYIKQRLPEVYKVNLGMETPDEPHAGFYWCDPKGNIHGSYRTRYDAQEAMIEWMAKEDCDE